MPVRDDWFSAAELIRRLDKAIPSAYTVSIILVDDGSLQKADSAHFQSDFSVIHNIQVLRLRRNIGHQRAIAIGLAYIQHAIGGDAIMVMDADGEDTPEGVVELLRAFSEARIGGVVFAERSRRSETLMFQAFYRLYRALHRGLTGIKVRVGNFSIISSDSLDTLVAMSELWNHYAATVFRSKMPLTMIPIARGHRIAGKSKMNFSSLVSHGLSAISVFADVVGVRLLITSLLGSCLSALAIMVVIIIRLFSAMAIPGWATYAVGILVIIMIQFLTIAASFTFFMLSNRTNLGFIPFRDYTLFVAECLDVYHG